MNALLRPYRLVPRGGAGLACDENGLALGNADLARVSRDAVGAGRCDVRSVEELGRLLSAAYGPRTDAEVLRLHRGLCRAAAQIGCGDLGLACIEAVMLGLPDLTADAMSKLAAIADLEKGANDAWETEPRIPSGQNGGGQWTTGGTTAAPTASDSPGRSEPEPRALGPISSDSGRAGEGSSAPGGSRSSDAIDANLLTPVSTAGAVVGGRGMAGDFALPENVARLGRAGLLALAAGVLDQWDAASARDQITKALARFGLDPSRPADVLAAGAYVWSQYALPWLTEAPFSGPKLDAASQAVMRFVLATPIAFSAIQNPTSQNAELGQLIVRAAHGGLADYAAESRARPPGVAPELQTTSRSARAAIADMLRDGGQAHHLVPADVWKQKIAIATLALKAQWNPNNPSNLIALPSNELEREKFGGLLPIHSGYHPAYNADVAALIDQIRKNFPSNLTPLEARSILEAAALRSWIKIVKGKYDPIMKVDL